MDGFSFSTDVRIRFAETDAQGIAHHASFVVWLEVARVAYLERHAGGYRAIRERGIEALTTEVHLRYHRAAYFDETLTVWTRCTGLRGARFTYEYRIERDGELVADGLHAARDRRPRDATVRRAFPTGSPRRSLRLRRRRRSVRARPEAQRSSAGVFGTGFVFFGSTFVPMRTTRSSPSYDVVQVSEWISSPSAE